MTKSILLVDVDSTIPNIALMRLSEYYKYRGYTVQLKQLSIPIYKPLKSELIIDTSIYEKVFVSAIFQGTMQNVKFSDYSNVDIGGTGSDNIHKTLPSEIEKSDCDYSIYPDADTSIGFISRGCIRNCEFCVVREKEGNLRQVAEPHDIIRHRKVKFLDNNFLALPNHLEILSDLVKMKETKMQFNQGLDIRLVTHENVKLLSQLNYMGEYIFAFDNLNLKGIVEKKLSVLKQYISKDWRIKFFLYCHPDMNIPNDMYYRILWCKENKVLPYFMRHQSCWTSSNRQTYNDFSAWCNQPGIFKTHDYKNFCIKRRTNKSYPFCCPEWFLNLENS